MKWFLIIFFAVCVLFFIAMIYVEKSNQRREIDSEYDKKVIKRINRIDPYYNFLYNLFGWILALLVFYYIYLG